MKTQNELKEMANEVSKDINAAIANYRNDKTIMDFVTAEAAAKVAAELEGKTFDKVTDADVIGARVQAYIEAGLIGVYAASL